MGVYRRIISLLSEKKDLGYWPGKADTSSPLLWSQRKKMTTRKLWSRFRHEKSRMNSKTDCHEMKEKTRLSAQREATSDRKNSSWPIRRLIGKFQWANQINREIPVGQSSQSGNSSRSIKLIEKFQWVSQVNREIPVGQSG